MSPYYYFFLIIFKNYNYRFWSSTEKNEFNSKITKRHKAVRTEGRYRENETHRSQQHCKNLRYLQSKYLSPYSKIKNANRGNPSVILSNRINRPTWISYKMINWVPGEHENEIRLDPNTVPKGSKTFANSLGRSEEWLKILFKTF